VLRGAAHYDWQFPEELFVARLLHEKTKAPVPWPYLYDSSETIFGWKYGYVIMPKMPGLQLADNKVKQGLSDRDKAHIAYALGENLREIQRVKWEKSGRYNLALGTVQPFDKSFADWLVAGSLELLSQSMSYNTGTTQADGKWVAGMIEELKFALLVPFTPSLVLHDYKEANMTVEHQNGQWKASGVFDLMEALFGDGELDIVRQLAAYCEEKQSTNAASFLDGYTANTALRSKASERLHLYTLYDRLLVWDYFHRPEHITQWQPVGSLRHWVGSYFKKLEQLV